MTAEHGNDLSAVRYELWSLREDVQVELEPDGGKAHLVSPWGSVTIRQPAPSVREALRRMRLGPISLQNVLSVWEQEPPSSPRPAGEGPPDPASARLRQVLKALDQFQPLIVRSLALEAGQPLLSVVPITPRSFFRPRPLEPDVPIRLSSFAGLSTDGHEYRLESPLALHRVVLHRAEASWLISSLARPMTPAAVAGSLPVPNPVAPYALEYLVAAGLAVQAEAPDADQPLAGTAVFAEDTDPALTGWSPVDLMFHTRSTLGRHDRSFGVTYPDPACDEPAVKPPQASPGIPLHRPRWDDLCAADPPFTVVMEGRGSQRDHGGEPVTVTEVGDLLYRTARVRTLSAVGSPGPTARTGHPGLSRRPYPGAGACYELELYLTVDRCAGLAPGVYHYDPHGHRLEPVSTDRAIADQLIRGARLAAGLDGPPQLLLTMTARFRRLSWKYEGLTYALALLDAGVLIQSLYLVCTAMGLAPCALGAVRVDLAARAFGTDWRVEPGLAQFIVGRAPGSGGDGSRRDGSRHDEASSPRPVNDAEWRSRATRRLRRPRRHAPVTRAP